MKVRTKTKDALTSIALFTDDIFANNKIGHCSRYPRGCCSIVSDLLGAALTISTSISVQKAYNGWRSTGHERCSHSWIIVNGTIVDVTCYQFADIWKAPYVGPLTDWHSSFVGNICRDINPTEEIKHWNGFYSKNE